MIGKCPERGTILVKDVSPQYEPLLNNAIDISHRCPSCTKKWHRSSELEWEQKE